jgi:hypothetical protein
MQRSILGLVVLCTLISVEAKATTGTATVVVVRGSAKTDHGKALAVKDSVPPGTTVVTGPRSFVRLLFADNTQMNLGPDTTMKLEPTKPGEASLVDLVGGQLRAKVAKDPLKKDNGDTKEKMVVKTRTAAMGIRGTDFNVSFNKKNNVTALVTFEGNVALAKLEGGGSRNPMAAMNALQNSSGVQSVGAGQFSGVQPDQQKASIPVKISPAQLETLKGNDTFQGVGLKSAQKSESLASPMPPGVDPKAFASGAEKHVKASVVQTSGSEAVQTALTENRRTSQAPAANQAPPEGVADKGSGDYAPRAGGFIDLNSGLYVPPPPGSSFDPNTGVFVPPSAMGQFDPTTGLYVPPKGIELDPVKGFVAAAPTNPDGSTMKPASAAGLPPPPAETLALVTALNTAVDPANAGINVTFDATFVPTGNSGAFVPPPPPPPPPPINEGLPPPPPEPVNNTYCPTCQQDNVAPPPPTNTNVNLHFSVQ